jgi:hypothetical protein
MRMKVNCIHVCCIRAGTTCSCPERSCACRHPVGFREGFRGFRWTYTCQVCGHSSDRNLMAPDVPEVIEVCTSCHYGDMKLDVRLPAVRA